MNQEKKIRRSHRLCPCNPMDIEGIQTWLEDMAAEGLLLEKDSIFCGFWSFIKGQPQKVRYRLEVVRSSFLDDNDNPGTEMVETAQAMGWEYVTRFRSFYIYRTFDSQARPLNTDPAVQSLTIKKLRRHQYVDMILDVAYVFVIFFLRRSSFGYLYRDMAMLGIFYTACSLGLFLFLLLRSFFQILYLHRAIRQLKQGEGLERRRNWKRRRPLWHAWQILPVIGLLGILGGLLVGLKFSTDNISIDHYAGYSPFASIAEVFPECTITDRTDMGDYNTFLHWETSLSRNTEWNESGDVTIDGQRYHFILRLTCHETDAPWLARGIEQDYYTEDKNRYHGKHFEDLEAPEVAVDSLRVYSSYGMRYVLLRHGSTVIHATVTIYRTDAENLWQHWLDATVKKLNR